MPNNSCTVVLNGHGCHSKNYIIDTSNINYNIIFPCGMGMGNSISNGHHNFLLNSFVNNIQNSLNILESLPTTYLSNRNILQQGMTIDMSEKHTRYIYDHGLSNAQDVRDVQSLVNIDAQKFVGYDVVFDNNIRKWNGTLNIEFDQSQVKRDVIQTHQNPSYQYNAIINLSQNNLLYIKPVASQNTKINFKFSDLLNDIFPKIKIPASYHTDGTVDILPFILLDDNTIQNKEQTFNQSCLNSNTGDVYHELVITGDANIIWDACRTEAIN
jgi:hypothetical protein